MGKEKGKSKEMKAMESWGTDKNKPVCDYCERLFLEAMYDFSNLDPNQRHQGELTLDTAEHSGGVASLRFEISNSGALPVPLFYICASNSNEWFVDRRVDYCPFCGRNLTQMVADAMKSSFEEAAVLDAEERAERAGIWNRMLNDISNDEGEADV